ncbi:MAG: glutathione S-transferase N-terminal domain-containing protein [Proteobacteria bacterium]|nr:glutathione S-transferase N-terminal domain-containing protein [Pseudomonadota bacterium]
MKLYFSGTSPYVRKVMACAITRGLDGRIEKVPTNPHESPAALVADNPLSKVPCLVTDDGLALFDSPVICEYLDSLGDAAPLFPAQGAARWRALKLQAVADGILDSAVGTRGEMAKPKEEARDAWMARQKDIIARAVAQLEADPPHKTVDIGSIAVACALGYLDFRFASDDWRAEAPRLAAWFEAFAQNPGIAQTVPA